VIVPILSAVAKALFFFGFNTRRDFAVRFNSPAKGAILAEPYDPPAGAVLSSGSTSAGDEVDEAINALPDLDAARSSANFAVTRGIIGATARATKISQGRCQR
jgi:hypothetical protein